MRTRSGGDRLWARSLERDAEGLIPLWDPARRRGDEAPLVCRNTGSVRTSVSSRDRDAYLDHARVPLPGWRPLSPDEHSSMWACSAPPHSSSVGLLTLPTALVAQLRELPTTRDPRGERIESDTRPGELARAVLRHVRPFCQTSNESLTFGFATVAGRYPTLTVCGQRLKHVGLHVDSWDRLSWHERDRASNRLCVNIGDTDRFLLFVNLQISEIARLLERDTESGADAGDVDVPSRFLEAFPDYPVIRVRLRPADAYVAPTENMIHDASVSPGSVSRTLTIKGTFRYVG